MSNLVVLAHRIPYPPNKGEKLRTFHQIEILRKQGHEITVIAPLEDQSDEKFAKGLADRLNIPVHTSVLEKKVIRLIKAVLTNQSFSAANFFDKKLMKIFQREIENADAVLFTASSLARYAKEVQLPSKTQKLMDFMDVDSDKWNQYAKQSNFTKSFIYQREATKISELEEYVLRNFNDTYVISAAEKNLLATKYQFDFSATVLGNGIDQSLFNPSINKPSNFTNFLFSGVMDYKPNIDAVHWFVENCWPTIVKQVPNARFVIAGMNPSNSIQALTQLKNVEVTGFVDDIKPYFDEAHVFVAPFQIARGVQNKVLQAMACALPIVTTSLGAEGILCQNNEDLVIADTQEQFSDYCIDLANNKEKADFLAANALKRINDNYAWKSVLQPLIKQLEVDNSEK